MDNTTTTEVQTAQEPVQPTKFCKHWGSKIHDKAVFCPNCGCQVEEIPSAQQPNIVINNSNQNTNVNTVNAVGVGRPRNKWTAFLLCFFLGFLGAHKFYEGKTAMGIVYLFTVGLFGIGWIIDLISILCKLIGG